MNIALKTTGIAVILLAIAFNIPFALLGSVFEYPDILRRPAAEVLSRFHAGGAELILIWYGFMLSAALMAPIAAALGVHLPALAKSPALRSIALGSGIAAGVLQAIGLSRWVFVVPGLARIQADPLSSDAARFSAQSTFDMLNLWGGVAIGEHLGQIFTILFILAIAISQMAAGGRLNRITGSAGLAGAGLILIGLGESIAIALGTDPGMLGLFTVVGYLFFTLWMILTGASLLRRQA